MNRIRFASIFAALLAAVMLGGCAKTNEVASTEATPAAGDAAAPESETATTESATGSSDATETAAPAEGEAPKN